MVFNTLTVGAAVTPAIVQTSFSHYLHRKPLRQKPTAHISYDIGLGLIRQFLEYASHHTVDDLQSFTAQWVPCPTWVRTEDIRIHDSHISRAAGYVQDQLGPSGVEAVGGPTWWQWRREGQALKAEWIEMRKDYIERKSRHEKCTRSMLYVHGGAYFFGSVDEHRYQIQRHARKLQARVLAPRYRLAPQFPFPCGLLDCLATYLQMLEEQPSETIVLGGDSAGAGMIVSIMVILRDQGLPLPAGAVLLSPWVDLTHSFPSVAGDNNFDYVPAHGFLQRPSMSWPPPNSDDLKLLEEARRRGMKPEEMANGTNSQDARSAAQSNSSRPAAADAQTASKPEDMPKADGNLPMTLDGKTITIKDQIQMYAPNYLLSHPLISPIMQPSLGGLPPLCILVGGGEMLRDEQIYLAHKAASPADYPPSASVLLAQGHEVPFQGASDCEAVRKHRPTEVQLQVWDDMCHVAPTLSFTRPAKFMYRSVAQFGAWALARAQRRDIEILDDDQISVISSISSDEEATSSGGSSADSTKKQKATTNGSHQPATSQIDAAHPLSTVNGTTPHSAPTIGLAGSPLPPFASHMIRQRVTRHGEIYDLEPTSSLRACTMPPSEIGQIKPGPVRRWLAATSEWNKRYAKEKRTVQTRRLKEMAEGYADFKGETPPPSALAGRRKKAYISKAGKQKKSKALALWSGWGSKHDEATIEREAQMEDGPGEKDTKTVKGADLAGESTTEARTRSKSRTRVVRDELQTGPAAQYPKPMETDPMPEPIAQHSQVRPAIGGQAFPFKLGSPIDGERNVSTMTVDSTAGIVPSAAIVSSGTGAGAGADAGNVLLERRPQNNRSTSNGFGIFDNREGAVTSKDSEPAPQEVSKGEQPRGLFAGSGYTWDEEALGVSAPDSQRPAAERFVTTDEVKRF